MQLPYHGISKSLDDTEKLSEQLLYSIGDLNVLALHGDLGSGKTTFSQGIGKALGITKRMVSPTFVIVRNYELRIKNYERLYHVDLYRIEKPEEVVDLGILDFVKNPNNLVIIEWAEKMGKYLPEKRVDMRFDYVDETIRKISISQA